LPEVIEQLASSRLRVRQQEVLDTLQSSLETLHVLSMYEGGICGRLCKTIAWNDFWNPEGWWISVTRRETQSSQGQYRKTRGIPDLLDEITSRPTFANQLVPRSD
jgi:hypothetical protein